MLLAAGKWLLVFDNADDAEIFQKFWPFGNLIGSVVMTSRNSTFVPRAAQKGLEVGPLGQQDSANMLLQLLSVKDKNHYMSVAKEVGNELAGLPLAKASLTGKPSSTADTQEDYDTLVVYMHR